jgi:hypothetical protein
MFFGMNEGYRQALANAIDISQRDWWNICKPAENALRHLLGDLAAEVLDGPAGIQPVYPVPC